MVPRIPSTTFSFTRRPFYHWLNKIWNNVDRERIKAVGPDRACAEWLMKNGAFVKWTTGKEFVTDYDKLPPEGEKRYIEEVDATNSSIMGLGFPHFEGCNHIKSVKLQKCNNIEDDALNLLSTLKTSLKHLQIISCWNVKDKGVMSLSALENLNTLLLSDLPNVKEKDKCVQFLKQSLKSCNIDFK